MESGLAKQPHPGRGEEFTRKRAHMARKLFEIGSRYAAQKQCFFLCQASTGFRSKLVSIAFNDVKSFSSGVNQSIRSSLLESKDIHIPVIA